jgi:hypothetical protein
MLRTVIIALVTGTAVGLDNLLARLAGWWHQTVPDDKFRAACERDQKYLREKRAAHQRRQAIIDDFKTVK